MISKIFTLITNALGHGNNQVTKCITVLYAAATTGQSHPPLRYKMCPEPQIFSKGGVIGKNSVVMFLSVCQDRLIQGPLSTTLIRTSKSRYQMKCLTVEAMACQSVYPPVPVYVMVTY